MKIGIYAGTFDPIHLGHINFAISAVRTTDLDKVVIVAEKNPYRKKPFASWDNLLDSTAAFTAVTSPSGSDNTNSLLSLL